MVAIVFPHQLFQEIHFQSSQIYLIEECLFFRQYKFHKQKIAYHRATMKFYENYLNSKDFQVHYIDSHDKKSDVRALIASLKNEKEIEYIDTTDNWLENRIERTAAKYQVRLHKKASPHFINSSTENNLFFDKSKSYHQTNFYIHQRKRHAVLVVDQQKPLGDKWTFDAENRLKYPKNKIAPAVEFPAFNNYYKEAAEYTNKHFSGNYGTLNESFNYPVTYAESDAWLNQFLQNRFSAFGDFEDAIVRNEIILHHSVLTPMLNIGLLSPAEIVSKSIAFATKNHIPLNSTEGFVRQIIGWREFIRAVYEREGSKQRTLNFWSFKRKMPKAIYTANTGILPVDQTIRNVLNTGYCHHIERLMVLGNYMLLCEIDPDEVYQWFMEYFIDAYDWVMVPNVYGMSQFADGGLMCTKPYISGSNYILKMSDYPKDTAWTIIWDALFWRFMHVHRSFFLQNPRLGMLVRTFDKMPEAKQQQHLQTAENYLKNL